MDSDPAADDALPQDAPEDQLAQLERDLHAEGGLQDVGSSDESGTDSSDEQDEEEESRESEAQLTLTDLDENLVLLASVDLNTEDVAVSLDEVYDCFVQLTPREPEALLSRVFCPPDKDRPDFIMLCQRLLSQFTEPFVRVAVSKVYAAAMCLPHSTVGPDPRLEMTTFRKVVALPTAVLAKSSAHLTVMGSTDDEHARKGHMELVMSCAAVLSHILHRVARCDTDLKVEGEMGGAAAADYLVSKGVFDNASKLVSVKALRTSTQRMAQLLLLCALLASDWCLGRDSDRVRQLVDAFASCAAFRSFVRLQDDPAVMHAVQQPQAASGLVGFSFATLLAGVVQTERARQTMLRNCGDGDQPANTERIATLMALLVRTGAQAASEHAANRGSEENPPDFALRTTRLCCRTLTQLLDHAECDRVPPDIYRAALKPCVSVLVQACLPLLLPPGVHDENQVSCCLAFLDAVDRLACRSAPDTEDTDANADLFASQYDPLVQACCSMLQTCTAYATESKARRPLLQLMGAAVRPLRFFGITSPAVFSSALAAAGGPKLLGDIMQHFSLSSVASVASRAMALYSRALLFLAAHTPEGEAYRPLWVAEERAVGALHNGEQSIVRCEVDHLEEALVRDTAACKVQRVWRGAKARRRHGVLQEARTHLLVALARITSNHAHGAHEIASEELLQRRDIITDFEEEWDALRTHSPEITKERERLELELRERVQQHVDVMKKTQGFEAALQRSNADFQRDLDTLNVEEAEVLRDIDDEKAALPHAVDEQRAGLLRKALDSRRDKLVQHYANRRADMRYKHALHREEVLESQAAKIEEHTAGVERCKEQHLLCLQEERARGYGEWGRDWWHDQGIERQQRAAWKQLVVHMNFIFLPRHCEHTVAGIESEEDAVFGSLAGTFRHATHAMHAAACLAHEERVRAAIGAEAGLQCVVLQQGCEMAAMGLALQQGQVHIVASLESAGRAAVAACALEGLDELQHDASERALVMRQLLAALLEDEVEGRAALLGEWRRGVADRHKHFLVKAQAKLLKETQEREEVGRDRLVDAASGHRIELMADEAREQSLAVATQGRREFCEQHSHSRDIIEAEADTSKRSIFAEHVELRAALDSQQKQGLEEYLRSLLLDEQDIYFISLCEREREKFIFAGEQTQRRLTDEAESAERTQLNLEESFWVGYNNAKCARLTKLEALSRDVLAGMEETAYQAMEVDALRILGTVFAASHRQMACTSEASARSALHSSEAESWDRLLCDEHHHRGLAALQTAVSQEAAQRSHIAALADTAALQSAQEALALHHTAAGHHTSHVEAVERRALQHTESLCVTELHQLLGRRGLNQEEGVCWGGLQEEEQAARLDVGLALERCRFVAREAEQRHSQVVQPRCDELLGLQSREIDARFCALFVQLEAAEQRHRCAVVFYEVEGVCSIRRDVLQYAGCVLREVLVTPHEVQARRELWQQHMSVVHHDQRRHIMQTLCLPGRRAVELRQEEAVGDIARQMAGSRRLLAVHLLQRAFRCTRSRVCVLGLLHDRCQQEEAEEVVERRYRRVYDVQTVQTFLRTKASSLRLKSLLNRLHAAKATRIQSIVRGYLARKHFVFLCRQRAYRQRRAFVLEERAAQRLQRVWRGYKAHVLAHEHLFLWRRARFHAFCATLLQSRWRGVAARRRVQQLRQARLHSAAVVCQAFARVRVSGWVRRDHEGALTVAAFLRARQSRAVCAGNARRLAAEAIQRAVRVFQSSSRVMLLSYSRVEATWHRRVFHEAACIQRVVRGRIARKRVAGIRMQKQEAEEARVLQRNTAFLQRLQRIGHGYRARRTGGKTYHTQSAACVVIQRLFRCVRARLDRAERARLADFNETSATWYYTVHVLQKAGRGHNDRLRISSVHRATVDLRLQRAAAAHLVCRVVAGGAARRRLSGNRAQATQAALCIQRMARSHAARRRLREKRAVLFAQQHAEMRVYSSVIIQDNWRLHMQRRKLAATQIQAAFLKARPSLRHRLECRMLTRRRRSSQRPATPSHTRNSQSVCTLPDVHAALLNVVIAIPLSHAACSTVVQSERAQRRSITAECVAVLKDAAVSFRTVLNEQRRMHAARSLQSLQRQALVENSRLQREWLNGVRDLNLRKRRVRTAYRRGLVTALAGSESLSRDRLLVDEYSCLEEAVSYHNQVVRALHHPQRPERKRGGSAGTPAQRTDDPGPRDRGTSAALKVLKAYHTKGGDVAQTLGGGWDSRISYSDCLRKMDERNREYDRTNGLYGAECCTPPPAESNVIPPAPPDVGSLYYKPNAPSAHRQLQKIEMHATERHVGGIHMLKRRRVDPEAVKGLADAIAGDYLTTKRVDSCGGVLTYVPEAISQRYTLCTYPTPPLVRLGVPGSNATTPGGAPELQSNRLAMLDLSNTTLSEEQVAGLLRALGSSTSVGVLKLVNCGVTDSCGPVLAEALLHNSSLFSLSLCKNTEVSDAFVACILPVVAVHPSLQSVDLYGTSVSQHRRLELANVIPPVFASPPAVPHKPPHVLPPLAEREIQAVDLSSVYSGTAAVMATDAPLFPGKRQSLASWQRANVIT